MTNTSTPDNRSSRIRVYHEVEVSSARRMGNLLCGFVTRGTGIQFNYGLQRSVILASADDEKLYLSDAALRASDALGVRWPVLRRLRPEDLPPDAIMIMGEPGDFPVLGPTHGGPGGQQPA